MDESTGVDGMTNTYKLIVGYSPSGPEGGLSKAEQESEGRPTFVRDLGLGTGDVSGGNGGKDLRPRRAWGVTVTGWVVGGSDWT